MKHFSPLSLCPRACAFLVALVLGLSSMGALAQNFTLKGSVVDYAKDPVIGAVVANKTSLKSAASDVTGAFQIEAKVGDQLSISFLGYATQNLTIQNEQDLNIVLQEAAQDLDQVVVVGYGTQRKSDLTSAVAVLKGSDLTSRPSTNPSEAMQGRIPGVNVQKFGGTAGSAVAVKIRGVNTFGSNEPLYIIDGFPGSINSINPNDIESMDVLKDGAAAAIYGSVAANGVVIVTTKTGKKDQIKVDVSSFISLTNTSNRLELLNADQYASVHKAMYDNYNQYASTPLVLPEFITNPTGHNTNWQDEIFRQGMNSNNSFSVRGGSQDIKFALSANLTDEEGIVIDNNYSQRNARAKVSFKKSIFEVDANMGLNVTKNSNPNFQLKEVYMISPMVPVLDAEEKYGYGLTNKKGLQNNVNPVAQEHFEDRWIDAQDITANVSLAINFTDYLQFKSSYSYRGLNKQEFWHFPDYIADPKSPKEYPYNEETRTYWEEQVIDNVLSFNERYGKHSINAMIGSSITLQSSTWNRLGVEGKTTVYEVQNGKLVTGTKPAGFLDRNFTTIDAGAGGTYNANGTKYGYNRVSFFARLNYSFDDKYLVQATMRQDGSSKFGSDSRWGTFPSVALGWRIDKEGFMPQDGSISMLKLRASWGVLGNEVKLGHYDYQSLIFSGNYLAYGYVEGGGSNPWPGSIAPALENRSIRWETTDSKNIGVDYGFFDNKLTGSLNYYSNQTDDLLINRVLPGSAGMNNPILNVGSMRNSGFEFEVNYNGLHRDFEWNIGMNFSTLKNEVVGLANPDQVIYGEGLKYGTEHFPTQTRMGMPMGAFYLYRTDGIFQSDAEAAAYKNTDGELYQANAKAGDIKFKDINGDGVIDDDDKEFVGSGLPKLEVNLNFGFNVKGIDFSMLVGSGWGHKIYNGNRYFYESMGASSNMLTSTLDAWTPNNTATKVPRAVLQDPNNNARESDRFLEDGDFIRLRNVQLGYSFPKKWMNAIHFERIRVYLSADNLFTWTNYSGIDPEFARTSPLNSGIDKLVYPMTRSFVFGLQVTF